MGDFRELEFKDGFRMVPDHLADMMVSLKTHTLTYDEAVEKANWKLASDFVDRAYDSQIRNHFRGGN